MSGSRMQRGIGIGLFAGMVILVLAMPSGGEGDDNLGSVRNLEEGGRRALASLLHELEFPVEIWAEAPGRLPQDGGLLWLACAPRAFVNGMDLGPVGDLHDPSHYRSFCENGGTLLLPAAEAEAFLVEGLGLEAFRGIEEALEDGELDRVVTLFGGPPNSLERTTPVAFDPRLVGDELEPLLFDEAGDCLAVELTVGRGRVVVLASDQFLGNGRLALADNAVLACRLAREYSRGGTVHFDEYALGAWKPVSTTELALGPRLFWLTFTVLLCLALYCWRHAWVRGFPREPERLETISPLTRARAVAGLHERARRLDLLADGLLRGMLQSIAVRQRLPRALRVGEPDEILQSLADHLNARDQLPEWRAQLLGRTVKKPQDLQRLEQALDSIDALGRGQDQTEGTRR